MPKIYGLAPAALSEFLAISREVRDAARGMTAANMREARAEILASARVHRAPQTAEERAGMYWIDDAGSAHIAIEGMLTPQASPCAAIFGEAVTEYGYIIAATRAADADGMVASITYEINSQGGLISGLDGAAQAMASVKKPTVAIVPDLAASAAYWLASQADRIVAASPSAQIGSIGVVCEEYDEDEALAREGVAHRIYTSTDAPDKRPDTKTSEGRAKIIAQLDDLHGVFVSRVAEGRHVTAAKVNADFGHGGLLIASAALAAGMIDEIVGVSISRPSADVVGSAAAQAAIPSKEVLMDLNLQSLKAEHPDVYSAAVKVGVEAERSRADGLRKWSAAAPGNAALATIVTEALASGKSESDVLPSLIAASQSKPVTDTPKPIPTATAETGANADGVTDEEEAVKGEAAIRALISGKPVKEAARG